MEQTAEIQDVQQRWPPELPTPRRPIRTLPASLPIPPPVFQMIPTHAALSRTNSLPPPPLRLAIGFQLAWQRAATRTRTRAGDSSDGNRNRLKTRGPPMPRAVESLVVLPSPFQNRKSLPECAPGASDQGWVWIHAQYRSRFPLDAEQPWRGRQTTVSRRRESRFRIGLAQSGDFAEFQRRSRVGAEKRGSSGAALDPEGEVGTGEGCAQGDGVVGPREGGEFASGPIAGTTPTTSSIRGGRTADFSRRTTSWKIWKPVSCPLK